MFDEAADELLAQTFQDAGVPSAPINGYAEALADPQSKHLKLVKKLELPGGHITSTVGCPVRINGAPVGVDLSLPLLGEHTGSVRDSKGWIDRVEHA